jgi:DNA-binding MarR family transcriptional regulator
VENSASSFRSSEGWKSTSNSARGATRLVDRLVEAGLVARETPSENRRPVYVRLRPEGEAVLALAQAAFDEASEVAFSDSSATETWVS